jgi:hypothetical protein
MQFVKTIDGEFGELFGIDLDAAVGRPIRLIRQTGAVAFDLAGFGVEQQGADGRAADVETYNVNA